MGATSLADKYIEEKRLDQETEAVKKQIHELSSKHTELKQAIERDRAVLEQEKERLAQEAESSRDIASQLEQLRAEQEEMKAEEKRLQEQIADKEKFLPVRRTLIRETLRTAQTLSRCSEQWAGMLDEDRKKLLNLADSIPSGEREKISALTLRPESYHPQDWIKADKFWNLIKEVFPSAVNDPPSDPGASRDEATTTTASH